MNRETQSLLVVLLGGAVLRISLGDAYLRYVKAGLRPWLVVSGVLLLALGVVSLVRDAQARRRAAAATTAGAAAATADSGSGRQDDGGHAGGGQGERGCAGGGQGEGGPRLAWLLLAPVLAIFLVAPPALGSYAADRGRVTVAEPEGAGMPPLPAGDTVRITLGEYATRAVFDPATLEDRRFALVGFVTPREGGGYFLARLVVSCCAADARPFKVAVTGTTRSFPPDTWVRAVGSYGGLDAAVRDSDGDVPILDVTEITPIEPPDQPYEN